MHGNAHDPQRDRGYHQQQEKCDHPSSVSFSLADVPPHRIWAAILGIVCLTIVAVAVVLVAMPSLRWRVARLLNVSGVPRQKELAVLPFTVFGDDLQAKPFADGLTETLTAKLAQLGERPGRPQEMTVSSLGRLVRTS